MVNCEMCGSDVNSLVQASIAGSIMNVCHNCKKSGNVIDNTSDRNHIFKKSKKENDLGDEVSNDYASLINSAMQNKKINMHQLARGVNIKESSLNNYIKGKIKPDINNAKKLSNFLGINLFEDLSSSNNSSNQDYLSNGNNESLSLGDMILKQMEKKNK